MEVDNCLLLRKKRDQAAAKAQNGGARAHVGPLVVPFFQLRLRQIRSCRSVLLSAATALGQISLPLDGWDPRAPRGLDVHCLSLLLKRSEITLTSPIARTGRGSQSAFSRHSLHPGLSRQFLFPTFPRPWRLSALSLSP